MAQFQVEFKASDHQKGDGGMISGEFVHVDPGMFNRVEARARGLSQRWGADIIVTDGGHDGLLTGIFHREENKMEWACY